MSPVVPVSEAEAGVFEVAMTAYRHFRVTSRPPLLDIENLTFQPPLEKFPLLRYTILCLVVLKLPIQEAKRLNGSFRGRA